MNVDRTTLPAGYNDPRMRGFRARAEVEEVLSLIGGRVARLGSERIDSQTGAGRVLTEEVVAPYPVPPFDRAAMDGYAVRGEETFGASAFQPCVLKCIAAARPGRWCDAAVGPGTAIEVTTGTPLPAGADTVVKVEATERHGDTVSVFEPTPPGRHVGRAGEDVTTGTVVLRAGRRLRPQDLGVLSAVGAREIGVVRRPRVIVVVTGDELLPAGSVAEGCRIADMNSAMLAALIDRDGGRAHVVGPLGDDRAMLRAAILDAAKAADLVLISGGSSTGPEDHAPGIVAELGELPVHGVALRPASPSGLGFLPGANRGEEPGCRVPVVLLPGNPVSCLCAYDFFAGPIVRRQGGRPEGWPYRPTVLPLARKLASVVGRVDYARVRIERGQIEPLAVSGASILTSTTRADGFVIVPAECEGYAAGTPVQVWLYDEVAGDEPLSLQGL